MDGFDPAQCLLLSLEVFLHADPPLLQLKAEKFDFKAAPDCLPEVYLHPIRHQHLEDLVCDFEQILGALSSDYDVICVVYSSSALQDCRHHLMEEN